MHGHDSHLAAVAGIEFALHFDPTGGEPVQEALQRRRLAVLECQGEGKEFVERVVRLRPQPFEHRATAADAIGRAWRHQHAGEQFMGRREIDARQQVTEIATGGAAPRGIGRAERLPQRAGTAMGHGEQVIVVGTDQRTLEDGGERQVVLRHQQEAAERDEVHHRKLVGQDHAVDTGDRHAAVLQCAHQLGEENRPGAHQHEDVARFDRPASRHQLLPPREPAGDRARNRRRQAGCRRRDPGLLDGRCPRRLIGVVDRPQRRPDFHQTALAAPERAVAYRCAGVGDHAVANLRIGEHGVDEVEDRRGGAERDVEIDGSQLKPGRLGMPGEPPPQPIELGRVGALEAEDRLFLVTHRKHRARCVAGPGAGEKLGRQRRDDLPLHRAGVLGFVDQHVVDPAVELVKDPWGDARPLQQVCGLEHQILVVQQGAVRLVGGVGVQQGAADGDERVRRLCHDRRVQPPLEIGQPFRFRTEGVDGAGRCGRHGRLRRQPGAYGPFLGQEGLPIPEIPVGPRRGIVQPGGNGRGAVPIAFRSGRQRGNGGTKTGTVEGIVATGRGQQALAVGTRGNAQMPPDGPRQARLAAVSMQRRAKMRPVPHQRGNQFGESFFAQMGGDSVERLRDRRRRSIQDARPGRRQQLRRRPVVDQLELGRQPGLDGEAAQQRLAEGVDGQHLQSAGGVQHMGEQPAGRGHCVAAGARAGQSGQVVLQRRIVGRRPGGEAGVDAIGHLRRRRFGEGDAENPVRRRAGEHQPQHPVGQHLGLAGTGRRPDPGRRFGVRCPPLRDLRRQGPRAGAGHHPASPAPADHSATRARWS